jgi:hypothetical protein
VIPIPFQHPTFVFDVVMPLCLGPIKTSIVTPSSGIVEVVTEDVRALVFDVIEFDFDWSCPWHTTYGALERVDHPALRALWHFYCCLLSATRLKRMIFAFPLG